MPGLVGIISRRPAAECERMVRSMTGVMLHEKFYASGSCSVPEMGIYGGWIALDGSSPASQPFVNERKDITLLLSGECFPDPDSIAELARRGHDLGPNPADWLVHSYEEHGEAFVDTINGLFSGLLIDRRAERTLLFDDRYGFDRLYYHETADELYFASEAAALLRVLPHLRELDPAGVTQFLAVGCTMEDQTLFKGLRLFPAGSVWSMAAGRIVKKTYFSPATWEAQPAIPDVDFQSRFQATLSRIVPRYFASDSRIGIALTGGLDSRMVLACRPSLARPPICYTYGGQNGEMLDTRLAARVAHACGMNHHVLRIEPDFLSSFAVHVDQTIRVTSGCFGLVGAHETYLNRRARELAHVRLTGVCGGEVLRDVSTFKPISLAPDLFEPGIRRAIDGCKKRFAAVHSHPVTFAAFREIPWSIYGTLAACRSQVTFRTPFLDNELVALAYQAPSSARTSSASAVRLIQDSNLGLSAIPTDMGLMGSARGLSAAYLRLFSKVTFKFDYLCNDGLPSGLSFLDPVFDRLNRTIGLPGLHKFLWYRRWFRRELADFIRERLDDPSVAQMPFWNPTFVRHLATSHISGQKNYLGEINAVLTLATVQRLMIRNG